MSDSSSASSSFSDSENDLELNLISNTSNNNLEIEILAQTLNSFTLDENNLEMANIPNFSKVHAETIPDFDGNENELQFFLESIDSIVNHFYDITNADNYQNVIIFRTIISKLKGNAREVINISGCTTINQIKQELIRNFSDPRDETCLSLDLNNLRQGHNESPYQFYDKVRKVLHTISNYLALHENDRNTRAFKQNMYNNQALQVFLAGLRNPYGIMVRTKEPQTMLDAINFIKKEDNIRYLQNNSNFQPNSKNFNNQTRPKFNQVQNNSHIPNHSRNFNRNNNVNFNQRIPQPQQSSFQNNNPQPNNNFPRGPIHVQPRPINNNQRYFSNAQVFGRTEPKNVWKPNPNYNPNNGPRPVPMTTTTRQNNNHSQVQSPQNRRWVSEELYNVEHVDNENNVDNVIQENNYDDYCELQYNNDNFENFHENPPLNAKP